MKHFSLYTLSLIFCSCFREEIQERVIIDNSYYEQAFSYLDESMVDSAFFYFSQAKDVFLAHHDSLGVAKSLVQMAVTLTDQEDYFGGQETSLEALSYLDTTQQEHHHYLSANFNNLGIASHRLRDFQNSLKFYDSAIRFSNDSLLTRYYLNNKAKAYQQNRNYAEALAIYVRIVEESRTNPTEYARALTNFTVTKWMQYPDHNAKPQLLEALHIRQRENDRWGQHSSYAHLADFLAERQSDSALFYAQQRYTLATQLNSANDQIEALQTLIKLSPAQAAKGYFETYQKLSDSVQQARATAKNQFALIRYEVEKNKAENLQLQQDNAEQAYQISRQRMITALIIFVTLVASALGVYWYKKRRQRLELEAQNRIHAHQLKTSRKIHDVVANGIYRVMAEIENKPDVDRDAILDRLESMYEKSRDISYETEYPSEKQPEFNVKIADLLTSFATDATKVILVGNTAALWNLLSASVKHEIEHILQELMVNMQKHSRASRVVIKFEESEQTVHIHYNDNGVGLPKAFQYGNGLRSTGNRIESIQGVITFDSDEKKGLKIQLSFPIS